MKPCTQSQAAYKDPLLQSSSPCALVSCTLLSKKHGMPTAISQSWRPNHRPHKALHVPRTPNRFPPRQQPWSFSENQGSPSPVPESVKPYFSSFSNSPPGCKMTRKACVQLHSGHGQFNVNSHRWDQPKTKTVRVDKCINCQPHPLYRACSTMQHDQHLRQRSAHLRKSSFLTTDTHLPQRFVYERRTLKSRQ